MCFCIMYVSLYFSLGRCRSGNEIFIGFMYGFTVHHTFRMRSIFQLSCMQEQILESLFVVRYALFNLFMCNFLGDSLFLLFSHSFRWLSQTKNPMNCGSDSSQHISNATAQFPLARRIFSCFFFFFISYHQIELHKQVTLCPISIHNFLYVWATRITVVLFFFILKIKALIKIFLLHLYTFFTSKRVELDFAIFQWNEQNRIE